MDGAGLRVGAVRVFVQRIKEITVMHWLETQFALLITTYYETAADSLPLDDLDAA